MNMKKKTAWKKIAKGEVLPCDSFIRRVDNRPSEACFCSKGVTLGQDAYYLPA